MTQLSDDLFAIHDIPCSLTPVAGGSLAVAQPSRGERVGIDPVLLAHFAPAVPGLAAADLGSGTGIIAALLLRFGKAGRAVAVEAEPALAAMAEATAVRNGLAGAIEVVNDDIRNWSLTPSAQGAFHLVTANPPYRAPGSGPLPNDALKAACRHETRGGVADFLLAAARALHPRGQAAFIFPVERMTAFRAAADHAGLYIVQRRDILPRQGEAPQRCLLLLDRRARREEALPPLVLHPAAGGDKYLPEAEAVLRGQW